MKKIVALGTMLSFVVGSVFAQKYDTYKNYALLNQFKKGKEEFDKKLSDEKFMSKPEAYLLKSALYVGNALDSTQAAQAPAYINDAYVAFQKYLSMEPAATLLSKEEIYKNGVLNLRWWLFNAGYKDYQNKAWAEGLPKFEKVYEVSNFLIAQKDLPGPIDTNTVILAGVLAENSKNTEAAIKYYKILADLKLNEASYEDVYRYLVRYYVGKKDNPNFEKYRALGKELYPKSDFFDFDKVDFAVGLEENWEAKIAALEAVVAGDPSNYKANAIIGELIYDTLNSRKDGAVKPANFSELEAKMVTALNKAAELNPARSAQNFIYLGDHYMNKAETQSEVIRELKRKAKPGAKPTAEEAQKLKDLQTSYDKDYDLMRDNYEKAAIIFGKKSELDRTEQRQYKIIVGNLAQYYSTRREGAKGAELTKYIAEEKKWNDLDEKLK
jgi:hypothetical protein